MNKFEQLIDLIINEEEDKARELFHNLVVEQSRQIYNEIIAEEAEEEEEEEEEMEESMMTMDDTDDMMSDIAGDEHGMGHEDDMDHDMDDMDHDMGDMEHDEGDIEDRVVDLEDALDDLKAEFERLMKHEGGEEDHDDMGHEDDMEDENIMREYVEKVGEPYKGNNSEGQPVGAKNTSPSSTNTRGIVAGKNDMGGTSKNLNQGGSETAPEGKAYSAPNNQYSKGKGNLPGAGSFENVPGAKAGNAFGKAKAAVTSDQSAYHTSPVAK
jgi:hypothetical protein